MHMAILEMVFGSPNFVSACNFRGDPLEKQGTWALEPRNKHRQKRTTRVFRGFLRRRPSAALASLKGSDTIRRAQSDAIASISTSYTLALPVPPASHSITYKQTSSLPKAVITPTPPWYPLPMQSMTTHQQPRCKWGQGDLCWLIHVYFLLLGP